MGKTRIQRRKKIRATKKRILKKRRKSSVRRKKTRRLSYRKRRLSYRKRKYQRGGYGAGAGPIGYPYDGGDLATWPGVAAARGYNSEGKTMSNYYPVSPDGGGVGGADPYFGTSDEGGVRGGDAYYTDKKQRGGKRNSIIPQDLVNFGRDILGGGEGLYMGWAGKPMPPSWKPDPTNQPLNKNVKIIAPASPDIFAIHKSAGEAVSDL